METIPTLFGYPLDVRGVFVLIPALALYVAFLWAVMRLVLRTTEQLRCPIDGRRALVAFLRGPDGSKTDVARCSLGRPGVVCTKECLRASTRRPTGYALAAVEDCIATPPSHDGRQRQFGTECATV